MTAKQEIAALKETVRQLTERIEQLEARPQFVFPYVSPQLPEPVYHPPQPLPVYPYTAPSTAPHPLWTTICVNE